MTALTEVHIGIVYFSGLLVGVISAVLIIVYLHPLKTTVGRITERSAPFWKRSFRSTLILAGLIGGIVGLFQGLRRQLRLSAGVRIQYSDEGV